MSRRLKASTIILWLGFLALVILTLNNLRENPITFPFNQIDEQGHISYALHLITHHRWWPDFLQFSMFDVPSLTELKSLNYINHPPSFYWLMKLAHMALPWWDPVHFRATALAFYLLAMLLYTLMGAALRLSIPASILYALMPLLVYMQLQIGFYNNDSLCVLGGMVVVAASLGWLRGKKPARALAWMGVGLLLTSVKLTALLLVGTYVLSCLLLRFSRLRMLPRHWLLYGLAVALLCAAPYVYMLVTLGSPAPNTAGQLALLSGHPTCRIEASARVTFTQWLAFFLIKFADQLSVSETTFLAILIYGTALLTVGVWRQQKPTTLHMDALRSVALASFIATLMTLTIHTIFSWQRYRDYGWICDSLLRYYLPLIGAYAAVSSHALMQFASHTKALDETPRP